MKQLSLLLGVGLLFAGVLPAHAQQSEGGATPRSMEHAEIGLLEAVGTFSHRIVIALPGGTLSGDRTYQSYDTNAETMDTNSQTMVEGLGSQMQVTDALREDLGHVVVVSYVDRGEHYLAKRLDFAPDRVIRETRGTIQSLDREDRTLVIKNDKGTEHLDMGWGPGAVIDSDQGLLTIADLHVGQQVTVEYGTEDRAYLLRVR